MTSTSDILIEHRDGHVLRLTLNRPDKRNALNDDLIGRLTDAFRRASADREVRAIVLGGAGGRLSARGRT